MTLDDHLASELTDILSTVSGLSVVTSGVANVITPPMARIYNLGESPLSDSGEESTRHVRSEWMTTVYIKGDSSADALNAERNERKEAIEYALQTHAIADYTGSRYSADSFVIALGDASGVFDDLEGQSSFVQRFSISYYKKVL